MGTVLLESLNSWWPEAILSLGALVVLIVGVFSKDAKLARLLTWVTILAAALSLLVTPSPWPAATFFGLILCDPFSLAFRWLAIGTTIMVIIMMRGIKDIDRENETESLGLLLLVTVGLMLMAEANHLLMAYVAMELVSLGSYALVGFSNNRRSSEASLKYLLFGGLSSGIMLFGISLIVGLTGALSFPHLLEAVKALNTSQFQALSIGIALLLAGIAFKISMVPFHLWLPDVYEGAPLPITAFLSVGPKAAGLALFVRLLTALSPAWQFIAPLVIGLTVVTMTLGNLVALIQNNIKRLLAYSTIGQVGYLLIGIVVNTRWGLEALLVYLVAYLFMNLGAFSCVAVVVAENGDESLEAFRGLSKRAPGIAICLTIFLLSLAGIPPLIGFFGKLLLLKAAIASGWMWLAVVAIINSAVSLYYYVNIIRLMYLADSKEASLLTSPKSLRLAVGVCGVLTLILGLFPSLLIKLLSNSTIVNLL